MGEQQPRSNPTIEPERCPNCGYGYYIDLTRYCKSCGKWLAPRTDFWSEKKKCSKYGHDGDGNYCLDCGGRVEIKKILVSMTMEKESGGFYVIWGQPFCRHCGRETSEHNAYDSESITDKYCIHCGAHNWRQKVEIYKCSGCNSTTDSPWLGFGMYYYRQGFFARLLGKQPERIRKFCSYCGGRFVKTTVTRKFDTNNFGCEEMFEN